MSDVLAQVLVRRGLGDPAAARAFLHPDFRVHDPYLMTGMAEARRRIDQALAQERAHRRARRLRRRRHHGDLPARQRARRARRRRALAAAQPLHRGVRRLLGGRRRARRRRRQAAHHGGLRHQRARRGGAGAGARHGRHRHRPPRARGRAARLHGRHAQDRRAIRAATSPASASPSSWRTRCSRSPATSWSTCRWPCARTPTWWPSAPSPTWCRWSTRTACSPRSGSAGCAARRARGWRRCWRSPAGGPARSTPAPSASVWRRGSTPPAASRTPRSRSSCSARRPRRGAAARAAAQRAQPRAADHRGGHPRGGRRHGPGPAAGRARALVAGLARGRRRHRRVARRRALPPSGDPAQRGRRRGQGLRAAASRPSTCSAPSSAAPDHLLAFGGHRAACGLRLRREPSPPFATRSSPRRRPRSAPTTSARARRRRRRRRPRAHPRARRRARAAGAARLRQPRVTLLLHGAEVVAPRLTRDHRHAQYRVRCDGASCQAIHFNFDGLEELSRARALRRAARPVEERVQRRRERPGRGQRPASARAAPGATCARPPATSRAPTGSPAAPCGTSSSPERPRGGVAAAREPPRSPRRARTVASSTVAAAPPCRRSPRWRPAASACSCSSPTSLAAARCSAATCSRRSSRAGAYLQAACVGRLAKRWPAPTS